MMRVLSLCSGIGGIDLAAEWAGMQVVGQVEIDPFCQAVLSQHWPQVRRMEDIREVVGDEFGTVDLVAGGIPCQPFSVAGKRRGTADDRHLWPEMLRIIERCQPTFVLVENVAGFVGMVLDNVSADLECRGYATRAFVLPAAAVGAPHLRERCFIVAYASSAGARLAEHRDCGQARQPASTSSSAILRREDWARGAEGAHAGGREDVANTARARLANRQQVRQRTHGTQDGAGMESEPQRRGAVAYAERLRRQRWPSEQTGDIVHGQTSQWQQSECDAGDGHADNRRSGQAQPRLGRELDGLPAWLDSHRWPARPGEAQYGWEAPRTIPASDKMPHRAAKLKALGNAVVPAQVYPVLAAIAAAWEATR